MYYLTCIKFGDREKNNLYIALSLCEAPSALHSPGLFGPGFLWGLSVVIASK
jgi:hypothetical protein